MQKLSELENIKGVIKLEDYYIENEEDEKKIVAMVLNFCDSSLEDYSTYRQKLSKPFTDTEAHRILKDCVYAL